MKVSINVPKGDLNAAKEGLAQLSEEVVEDEKSESYIIHLGNGDTIKPNEVSVQKRLQSSCFACQKVSDRTISATQHFFAARDTMHTGR